MPDTAPDAPAHPITAPGHDADTRAAQRGWWTFWVATVLISAIVAGLVLTARTIRRGGTTGDFPVFYWAGLRLPLGENIYEKIPQAGEYIYPPLLAAIFTPISKLGQAGAAWCWGVVNAAILVGVLALVSRDVVRRIAGRTRAGQPLPLVTGLAALTALVALVLSIDKTSSVIGGGQTDMLMVLGVALGMIWHDRRPALAGWAVALAANIKYTPLAFVGLMLWRRRFTAAAWTIAAFAMLALAPALVVGWERNIELWLIALGGVARLFGYSGGTVFAGSIQDAAHPLSVSITSAFTRWFSPEPGKTAALAASGLVALAVAAGSWAMYARAGVPLFVRDRGDGASPILSAVEWSGVVIAVLAFSPQTQGRHLVTLLPVHVLAAGMLLSRAPGVPRGWLLAGVLINVLGMTMPPGGKSTADAVLWWRSVGGAGWCLLPLWFSMLWTGLRLARAQRDARELGPTREPAAIKTA